MNVSILGSGVMGSGIASLLLKSESVNSVYWWIRNPKTQDKSFLKVKKELRRLCKGSGVSVEHCISKLSITEKISELGDSDLFVEAIAESTTAKNEIIREVAEIAKEDAIFATNTSSLSITDLSMNYVNPENFVGMHFFNPTSVMNLVEIVKGLATSSETVEYVSSLAKLLNKETVIVKEAPGFIVNRMLIPMINEAITILSEGVASKEDIDKAMKLGANHPLGPIALADLIGNDVCLSIMETLHAETGDPKYRANPMLRQYVRAGRLGRKCKLGFYDY